LKCLDRLSLFLRGVERLQNSRHFLGVLLLIIVLVILRILGSGLGVSIFESTIQVKALDVAVSHNTRNLLVVVQDRKTGQLFLFIQEGLKLVVLCHMGIAGVVQAGRRRAFVI
jgi:hypothetical protein